MEAAASLPSSVFILRGIRLPVFVASPDPGSRIPDPGSRILRSRFRHHRDRATRALVVTDRAAGTPVQVVPIAAAGAEFDDRLLRARGVATIALEAIAARQASLRFIPRALDVQAADDLVECRAPALDVDRALPAATGL